MQATRFEFVSYTYTKESPEITFLYRMHFSDADAVDFEEKITLPEKDWATKLPESFSTAILDDIHILLGISYYKLFCPPEIQTTIQLSQKQAAFWNTVYKKGLGEFLYRNNLSTDSIASFSANVPHDRTLSRLPSHAQELLIGIGGGKDSIVALELLQDYGRTGFVVETGPAHEIPHEVARAADVPVLSVYRTLDQKVLDGIDGAYKGHVPVSAMYAFLGVFVSALEGKRYFVVANEHSSNFGNFDTEGNEVNHKWSGSSEFEALFQSYLREQLSPDIGYFSLTRPFYELKVVQLFAVLGEKYFNVFASCNRNFAHAHKEGDLRWCGECPKCAFTFLSLSAFLDKEALLRIFKKNLFEDAQLLPLYIDLLGLGDMKPFDCVGTFDESKVALYMASERFADTQIVQELLPKIGDVSILAREVFCTQKATTVPSQFRFAGMDSVLLLGYGKEGHATDAFLREKYPTLMVDTADAQQDEAYMDAQENYDLIIKTPSIPQEQVRRQYTTATNLFFNAVPRTQIIGVTGSKGKSTTATLLYQMLQKTGKDVRLVGNIGTPALQSLLEKPVTGDTLFVFELSSYQLADLDISPHIAVVTSLFPEHLDHHGSVEKYYEAKGNITRFQTTDDFFFYQKEYPLLQEWADATQASSHMCDDLTFPIENTHLLGTHNKHNAALAVSVAAEYGVTQQRAQEVLAQYEGLPHRLQNIGTYKGITFYDDSISTTPESAAAALQALESVQTIILGGVDRGYTFTELEQVLREKKVQNVILFPESGAHILQSEEGLNVLHTDNMEEAIQFAYKHTPEGGVCLLSPAAPSYNLFTNFEARAEAFSDAVQKYGV